MPSYANPLFRAVEPLCLDFEVADDAMAFWKITYKIIILQILYNHLSYQVSVESISK